MAKPWKWWYQILPQHDSYESDKDWACVIAECARDIKTVAGWYATEDVVLRGKVKTMTLWHHHPDRAVRLRWAKIHRAMVRLFRHGYIAWYRHDRDGTLSFEESKDIPTINSEPIVCLNEHPAHVWEREFSPDTIAERKTDKRWETLKYMTYANKRKFMGLSDAEKMESRPPTFYEYVPNILVEKIMESRSIERKQAEHLAVVEVIGRVRERDKQNIADAHRKSADARGMFGTWTTEDGGAWRKYINARVVVGRTHDELIALIRAAKGE
jgi:hypothetical protein